MKPALTTIVLLFSMTCVAQVGDKFPEMNAENLENKFINLPDDISGKYSLLCLAYSKKSEELLVKWFNPIYNNFIHKPKNPGLFQIDYDINTYFIPMFTGAKRTAYSKVMEKAKNEVDPLLRGNVLFYEGSMKTYKTALSLEDDKLPYFYILDPEGNIVHFTSGIYTDNKMQEIINAVSSSMN